ncbi:MAG: hypothetical protein KC635_09585, partial [Myxococcales bacterium]|nr:hypothetical protein [Myxococcales bacterium]
VLDEPSIGLHMSDVPKLLEVVHRLVDAGATVVVVEHNPDVMREADWIIDLGPGPGEAGGEICYQGPYDGLVGAAGSRTGRWLAAHADNDDAAPAAVATRKKAGKRGAAGGAAKKAATGTRSARARRSRGGEPGR